ncbi:8711_t:CDS:2 [Funneliformis geosporum]|uniref:5969_t:CDS:1 n=1 Tax=Funneliformis geosporum TaxID=1117311 RepID=A0A9W4X2D7_9GLOM|nr:5969_t:CDS:2 [Funneliformis geosporum]CAI2182441.1 8711_t:CDS:2 [Funneliformis geosporum]
MSSTQATNYIQIIDSEYEDLLQKSVKEKIISPVEVEEDDIIRVYDKGVYKPCGKHNEFEGLFNK